MSWELFFKLGMLGVAAAGLMWQILSWWFKKINIQEQEKFEARKKIKTLEAKLAQDAVSRVKKDLDNLKSSFEEMQHKYENMYFSYQEVHRSVQANTLKLEMVTDKLDRTVEEVDMKLRAYGSIIDLDKRR